MAKKTKRKKVPAPAEEPSALAKTRTGIRGLDEITFGGLPSGRPTLIAGAAGCGKTLLAMEFIVRGITEFGEPGVFMTFEETAEELARNVASLGFDLNAMIRRKQLAIDHVRVERSEIEETGEYDLDGLFIRLASMIDEVGAKRVAIDTVEALFSGLTNEGILRAELRRLFRWLKDRGVTAVITGEQGASTLTRHGLDEYVSDCVIFLDHRVINEIATRRLRVVKYRGSSHGTNEYPAMIDEGGLSVLPISSLGLDYEASTERVFTGVERLDAMLNGGYYRGSSILVSGSAGTGKSSMATAFADGLCRRGERCLYLAFEESPAQIIRNMTSIGYDLGARVRTGRLRFHAARSTLYGLEQHLVNIHRQVDEFQPTGVVMDPITNLMVIGDDREVKTMLTRMIDFLKSRGITALFTSLTEAGHALEQSEVGVSSLMDTWLLLRNVESAGERNRLLFILKSRGMAHSNQVREFLLTDEGIRLRDIYIGPGTVLAGSARMAQEARDQTQAIADQVSAERRRRELQQEEALTRAQLSALQIKTTILEQELEVLATAEEDRLVRVERESEGMARQRGVNVTPDKKKRNQKKANRRKGRQ